MVRMLEMVVGFILSLRRPIFMADVRGTLYSLPARSCIWSTRVCFRKLIWKQSPAETVNREVWP